MRICFVTRECEGLAGAGGLKDVVRGLADALVAAGSEATVIMPRYGFMSPAPLLFHVQIPFKNGTRRLSIQKVQMAGIRVLLVEASEFAQKAGIYTYSAGDKACTNLLGRGYTDAREMNAIFQAASAAAILKLSERFDIIHGHDGHTGLVPAYLKLLGAENQDSVNHSTPFLLTIHNAGRDYQQRMGSLKDTMELTGLPEDILAPSVVDGEVNPILIAGLLSTLNTVSSGYADELNRRSDPYSRALTAALVRNKIHVSGIINGLDAEFWLRNLPIRRGPLEGESRQAMKRVLSEKISQNEFSGIDRFGEIPDPEKDWILYHGRITHQKGINDILQMPLPDLLGSETILVFYGQGDSALEESVRGTVSDSQGCATFLAGYHEDLTAPLIASSEFLLVPSLWEPCGQIDMAGQLLGALPIVRRTGGLKKIRNHIDGFSYAPTEEQGLVHTLKRALTLKKKHPTKVSRMRKRAENRVYGKRSWRKVLVQGYFPLYKRIIRNQSRRRNHA